MSCIAKGNVRCTRCCEAIHIPRSQWISFFKGKINIGASASIRKYWTPISHRRAKKLNPYVFNREGRDVGYIQAAQFFKCKALVLGQGCSVRDAEDHPEVCKTFYAEPDYSPTCSTDVNIIARSVS